MHTFTTHFYRTIYFFHFKLVSYQASKYKKEKTSKNTE